jgi:transposase
MSKYSDEFKLKVVDYYLNNHGGYGATANYFDIPSFTTVKKWVKKYQEHGIRGILKNQKKSYSGEFKQNVIEYIHKTHLSYQETAIHFNIAGAEVINKWERIYYEEGPQALYQERRGKKNNMSSKTRKKKNVNENEDLLEEVQRLRMENEYLKKLNALVQERIKRENKKK